MVRFQVVPDCRTSDCSHDQTSGCHHCCLYCDLDSHRCGACAKPMQHVGCSGMQLGTCDDCRAYLFADPEEGADA